MGDYDEPRPPPAAALRRHVAQHYVFKGTPCGLTGPVLAAVTITTSAHGDDATDGVSQHYALNHHNQDT